MKRLIEIEDKWVPDGYEPVAFRRIVYGDAFLVAGFPPGKYSIWTEAQDVGPVGLVIRETTSDVNAFDQGTTVLVSNLIDGPYVNRVLVSVISDRDYPFVCESISHVHSHECWRFAKKVVR